jgi:hypothetical protein
MVTKLSKNGLGNRDPEKACPESRIYGLKKAPDPGSATLTKKPAHHECGFEIAISSHVENKEAAAHHEVGLRDGEI